MQRKKFKIPDTALIKGVILQPLKVIPDERGRLMEIMRTQPLIGPSL